MIRKELTEHLQVILEDYAHMLDCQRELNALPHDTDPKQLKLAQVRARQAEYEHYNYYIYLLDILAEDG